jgi:DNA-binding transcriptional regulator YdaS (Cro superfamily)
LGVYRPGIVAEIATGLGVTTASVCQWQRVPAARVPGVARILGVKRHQLRPDLWDKPPTRARR